MRKIILFILLFIPAFIVIGQVRNGWRSIYDKEGRLTRMNYYNNGINVSDSNFFFQYYTENILKGMATGVINPKSKNINGTLSLFDYSGMLSDYHIKAKGQAIFEVNCDYYGKCTAIWSDLFDVKNSSWQCDSFSISNSNLIIHNNSPLSFALYKPKNNVDLNSPFVCRLRIPIEKNTRKQGIALAWQDNKNFFSFEIASGNHYTIQQCKNGVIHHITNGLKEIEQKSLTSFNEITIHKNEKDIIFEINGNIEIVLPSPEFKNNQIAFITRSKGNSQFGDFVFKQILPVNSSFYNSHWVGKGTGFFISPRGQILTTYDAISEAKSIRVTGQINGTKFQLPAKVIRKEESNNLAILQIIGLYFRPIEQLPYGYTEHVPISGSKVFSIGFPNATSGIYMSPEIYEGIVLQSSASLSGYRLLEMPFRYGMIGSPVFDNDANLIGVCAYKGLDLKYSEMIDFYNNSRLFKANMGLMERKKDSPYKNKSNQEKIKALSEIVVIIESSVFDIDSKQ